jgi:hypothetical protein
MTITRFHCLVALALMTSSALSAARVAASDVIVGQSLAATANVTLSEAAPAGGLQVTLTSENANMALLSKTPEAAGSPSIVVTVQAGVKRTPDFYVYGLGTSGTTTYLASAPGYGHCSGTVRLAPSSIVIQGTYGVGRPMLLTTGSNASKITLHAALIGSSGEYVSQPVAGGRPVTVNITTSNEKVGTITPSHVTLAAGAASTTTTFQVSGPGITTLVAGAPGFSAAPQHGMVTITAITPGIGIMDQVAIGRDLEIGGTLSLGQPAPAKGLRVTLTSNNPKELLVSRTPQEIGSPSITIDIPAGGFSGLYHLQSLSDAGTATYTASAPGYLSRTGTVHLTPSGVVIGLEPPDEAEIFRKEAAEGPHGLVVNLSRAGIPLTVYMVQLDPATHRGADITVQPLRAGFSAVIEVKSSDPSVGTIGSQVSIQGGSASAVTQFHARKEGTTLVSAATPAGFTTARNSTSLTVIVKP